MAHAFPIKKDQLIPTFAFVIEDDDGNPIDLAPAASGAAIASALIFHMRASGAASTFLTRTASIMQAASGLGHGDYQWVTGDTATAAHCQAEVEILWSAASKTTRAPADGFYPVKITERLP